jgi:hypothetical protein
MSDQNSSVPAVQPTSALAESMDYGTDKAAGFEGTTATDVALPFLTVLQQGSPEVSGEPSQRIANAAAGMLLNSVTGELYDGVKGIVYQPVAVNHVFVEWRPRTAGGGYVGVHAASEKLVVDAVADQKANRPSEFGKYKTPTGNELVETYYVLGLIHRSENIDEQINLGGEPVLVTFQSTKIQAWKKMTYRLLTFIGRPPLFAHRIRVSTFQDKNSKGTFFNFKLTAAISDDIKASLIPPKLADGSKHPLLQAGFDLNKAFSAGLVNVNYSGAGKTGSGSAAGGTEGKDDDIPF